MVSTSSTLRSTIALANVYYNFGLDGHFGAGGSWGLCRRRYRCGAVQHDPHHRRRCAGCGTNFAAAGALMAGVSYDIGTMVADVGYRMIYMPEITTCDAHTDPSNPYYINNNVINEIPPACATASTKRSIDSQKEDGAPCRGRRFHCGLREDEKRCVTGALT